uniref:RING-type domain-containing protein n=1 Tax=Periophthalmus magnuspinnatus TaxID=409849 RepID=A0A3B4ACE9_9GOBI
TKLTNRPLGAPDMEPLSGHISESELSCHCCYNILLDPTTLTCGHSVCRPCLAMWWHSSKKNECPECREKWVGFPKINILLRLLLMLGEEELLTPPYSIQNPAHRRTVLAELDKVRTLGVKPPQNLWEYKAAYPGMSLFLLYSLKRSPRLTLLYLYLFEYSNMFLPFLHTCCPAMGQVEVTKYSVEPSRRQWAEFLVKYALLPYQLMAEFACDWLSVHYWTSRFIIVNAMQLSVLDVGALWRLWARAGIRAVPGDLWNHLWELLSQGLFLVLLWPITPHFLCSCLFYWGLYFSPILNMDRMVRRLLHPDTNAV